MSWHNDETDDHRTNINDFTDDELAATTRDESEAYIERLEHLHAYKAALARMVQQGEQNFRQGEQDSRQ